MNTMVQNWKNILLIIMTIGCFLSIKSCNDNKKSQKRMESAISIWKDSVEHLRDENGELINRKQSAELTGS